MKHSVSSVTLKTTRPARTVRNYGRKREPRPDELSRISCRYELRERRRRHGLRKGEAAVGKRRAMKASISLENRCTYPYVRDKGMNFPIPRRCEKRGRVTRNGKLFCGVHDPEAVRAREDARAAKFDRQHDILLKRHLAADWMPDALVLLKQGIEIGSSFRLTGWQQEVRAFLQRYNEAVK